MASYRTSLQSREYIAKDSFAVHLAKPPGFTFRAGQYADLILVDPPYKDLWGNLRTFSMVSAPFESTLEFVMRSSASAFKRALSTAPVGTVIELKGPAGNIQLHADANRPAVCIAGGVGIAPFISILRQAQHDRAPHHFCLFYSNRWEGEIAYLDELKAATHGVLQFDFIPTITGGSEAGWKGERGRIDSAMLRRHVHSQSPPVYYIAGPSQFVSGMISALTAMDVGETDVQIEDFGEF